MRASCTCVLLLSALLAGAPSASAQMMVDRDRGERVDAPYAPSFHARRAGHRYDRRRHSRFLALRRDFPAPDSLGWSDCCL